MKKPINTKKTVKKPVRIKKSTPTPKIRRRPY